MRALVFVLLSAILGVSLIAAGLRTGVGIASDGVVLRDCVGGPQVHNYDAPGQPPQRLLDTELRKVSDEEDGDELLASAGCSDPLPDLGGPIAWPHAFAERRTPAAQQVYAELGARGPPYA